MGGGEAGDAYDVIRFPWSTRNGRPSFCFAFAIVAFAWAIAADPLGAAELPPVPSATEAAAGPGELLPPEVAGDVQDPVLSSVEAVTEVVAEPEAVVAEVERRVAAASGRVESTAETLASRLVPSGSVVAPPPADEAPATHVKPEPKPAPTAEARGVPTAARAGEARRASATAAEAAAYAARPSRGSGRGAPDTSLLRLTTFEIASLTNASAAALVGVGFVLLGLAAGFVAGRPMRSLRVREGPDSIPASVFSPSFPPPG